MPHRNDMTHWEEIRCQRGHESHDLQRVHVDLSVPHGYQDLPQVPARLACEFDLFVYPPAKYPVDGGPYCPAHDAVSETIVSHGIWEPCETILTLQVCGTAGERQMMVDFGAQIGWFSHLAACSRVLAIAIDADSENLAAINAARHEGMIRTVWYRVGERLNRDAASAQIGRFPIRLAKIDVEGAEADAVQALWPSIEAGNVDHLLIEVSPVFIPGDHYPDLVERIIDAGYVAYWVPEKRNPPVDMSDIDVAMRFRRLHPDESVRRVMIRDLHQANIWFRRLDASW